MWRLAAQVVAALAPHVVTLSMHKFASNVVEKCLTHGSPPERDALIRTILGTDAPPPAYASSAGGAAHSGHLPSSNSSAGPLATAMAGLQLGGGFLSAANSRAASVTGALGGGSGGADGSVEALGVQEDLGAALLQAQQQQQPAQQAGGAEDALTVMMKDQFGNYVVQRVRACGGGPSVGW